MTKQLFWRLAEDVLVRIFWPILFLFPVVACQPANFTDWRRELFAETPVTQNQTKMISMRNDNSEEVQKISGIGFDGSGDGRQHFRIDKITVGDRPVSSKDIVIPPGSSLNIQMTYEPRSLETTNADFGGWITTSEPAPFVPHKPGEEPEAPEEPEAIHRALLIAVYETPKSGVSQIELVGRAVPGPNGEVSLPEAGTGICESGPGRACFTGIFSMDIPDLFTEGPVEEELIGPIRFAMEGGIASLNMSDLPPILIVLRGNGPGEPLEGQPVSSVSIIVKGVSGVTAQGTFDGSRLELSDLGFRIQVVVGEITREMMTNINPIVDFTLENLRLTTEEPLVDGQMTLLIDTTLSDNPSGNPIFDEFFGNKQILVRFRGNLAQ